MIYTSNYERIKYLPDSVVPISIAGKAPDWYNGLEYKKLAPSKSIYYDWHDKHHDDKIYSKRFLKERLNKLDCSEVLDELHKLADNKSPCLICYEDIGKFCHRHLVSAWIGLNGYVAKEFRFDDEKDRNLELDKLLAHMLLLNATTDIKTSCIAVQQYDIFQFQLTKAKCDHLLPDEKIQLYSDRMKNIIYNLPQTGIVT